MPDPEIAQKSAYAVDLVPGAYWWCAWGRSETQLFGDGSHKGTDFTPLKIEIGRSASVRLCERKRSSKNPFCDGTHKAL